MAYEISDSRYGVSFKTAKPSNLESFTTKSINYVNLKLGNANSGYTPAEAATFIDTIAASLIGAGAVKDRIINDQIQIDMVP